MESNSYGILLNQEKEYEVVNCGSFQFDFIRIGEELRASQIKPQNNYLHCKTLDKKDLLVYLEKEFNAYGKLCHLTTNSYIYGEVDGERIRGIRFSGGILSNLFVPASMEIKPIEKGSVVYYKDDSIKYVVELGDKTAELQVSSTISESDSVEGSSLSNGEVYADLIFENELSLGDIRTLIIAFLEACQFMASRKNIGFDRIELLSEYSAEGNIVLPCADIYFKYETESFTKKRFFECLSFEEMGDAFPKLFRSMYLKGTKKIPFYSLDFLVNDDKDSLWFDGFRLKSICTAIESEADRQGIKSEKNKEFEELKSRSIELLNEYATKSWMEKKTYDSIESNIRNWDYAAYNKCVMLFEKYKEWIFECNTFIGNEESFIEDIALLIRYRNNSTHGAYSAITTQIVDVAYNFLQVIYCSRLDSLGMAKEMIISKIKSHSFY